MGVHSKARKFQEYVQERLADVKRLIVVDIHTGVGPFGIDTLLVPAADEGTPLYTKMYETFGERVSSLNPDRGPAFRIRGIFDTIYPRVLPRADMYSVIQEFGTYNSVAVLKALRAENRWAHYGDGSINDLRKLDLKEAFSPEDESWREAVLDRGKVVIRQALGLTAAETRVNE